MEILNFTQISPSLKMISLSPDSKCCHRNNNKAEKRKEKKTGSESRGQMG